MATLEELEEEKRNERIMQEYEVMLHKQIEMQKQIYFKSVEPFVKALADLDARRPITSFIQKKDWEDVVNETN